MAETEDTRMVCFRVEPEVKKHVMQKLVFLDINLQSFFVAFMEHFINVTDVCMDGEATNFKNFKEMKTIIESAKRK